MLKSTISLVLTTCLLASAPLRRPLVIGIDHTPLAVHNLTKLQRTFPEWDFALKAGRPHDDGIQNRHIKFPNNGEIELITASCPKDDLAKEYADWLAGSSDGVAFWSLYAPDQNALTQLLSERGLQPKCRDGLVTYSQSVAPHRVFFAGRLPSPTDGPAYWSHPNTAYKLAKIWLSGTASEGGLLEQLGARMDSGRACSPFDSHPAAYVFPAEGDEVLISKNIHTNLERTVIGLTVLVRSLATARLILDANHIGYVEAEQCDTHSIWVKPSDAHGVWLEFAQGIGSN